jgi:hypothetical protein
MSSQIETPVTVRYDTQTPEKLYSFSILRIVVSFLVAAIVYISFWRTLPFRHSSLNKS